jgi:hypothetical protein
MLVHHLTHLELHCHELPSFGHTRHERIDPLGKNFREIDRELASCLLCLWGQKM